MNNRVKHLKGLRLLLLPVLALFVASCENDLNKVKEISSNEVGIIVSPTTGVDLIMSDSARVQMHLTAPLLLEYQTKKPYKIAPKGIKIIHYDKITQKEDGTIIADTGILHAGDKLYEFRKNVVATNAKGETYKSDELFWNSETKKVYSHKNVEVTMNGGNVMNGDDFESDDKFLHPKLRNSKGVFHVDENATQ
ncbi:LPS export ABC transporter periplasmic protein LptC [Mucilaginibacter sabulilitoris]|uniref:LPS export ABC transporter periplasmic protein LptC n=1 Tax=Mucilaginibacter sabulilitoris TaxID=1173583 RepID=A0ABZ0TP73_9SPHI|nr:LPS export ABC transporter periplasmic protein LptC [Mucilaginibacter sabulilitoris]WPU93529.1 LPS export ABC transporter periplasmic protein LptC [Mucilaginibacter sabulilitoris]